MNRVFGKFASVAAGLLALGLLIPSQAAAAPGHATRTRAPYSYHGAVPLPDTGVLWGAYVPPDAHNGPDRRTALTNYETLVGRPLALERVYYLWNEAWPTADDTWSAQNGHTLYISWNASPDDGSGCRKWNDIANGVYDADIHAQAARIVAFPYPFIFSFHHEPTTAPPNHQSCGTPEEYQAAWRHIHDTFVADGVTNVSYGFTSTALSFDHHRAEDFYPGDDIIDIVAADGYNWFGCTFHPGPWREMSEIFANFNQFGIDHDKPLIIGEYGSGEDPDVVGKKGQWFTNGADQLKKWPLFKGVMYFNVGNGGTSCDRYVDSTPTALTGFSTMGADPYFNPPVTTTEISISDGGFTPGDVTVPMGSVVRWTNNGTANHTVVAKKMALFNSGTLNPGDTFVFVFTQAGTYSYRDSLNGALQGAVKVAPTADPPTGGVTTTFTIKWSADLAPDGYSYDAQIKRPGGTWTNWKTNQNGMKTTFVPDSGVGKYTFRARYVRDSDGAASGWSPGVQIVVS
jgi:plastocyanin